MHVCSNSISLMILQGGQTAVWDSGFCKDVRYESISLYFNSLLEVICIFNHGVSNFIYCVFIFKNNISGNTNDCNNRMASSCCV